MKAYLDSVRIAPKKANLIAKMVRGMPVPDAVESLRRTNKKAARIIETLLDSAVANASHNDRQDPQTMVIKSIVVNQGQAYRRGMPMARGRTRPYRKFLSHITLVLGFPEIDENQELRMKKKENGKKKSEIASQEAKNPVKTASTRSKKSTKATPASDSSAASNS